MDIYRDPHDRLKYIDILLHVKRKFKYELYAFCLMTNHNHLLIKEADTEVSKVMASINIRYSMYFNKKYRRVGSLFQERYRSEPIRSEPQLLVCSRYIHNNPVKAGITKSPGEYRWSSYHDYLDNTGKPLLDTYYVLDILGADRVSARSQFISYTGMPNEDSFIDDTVKLDDEEAKRQVEIMLKNKFNIGLSDVKCIDYDRRCAIIATVRNSLGLTYTGLGKILDITKDSVYRACLRQSSSKK